MDEGLDIDILMQVLDGIAQIDLPASKETVEKVNLGRILLPHLAKLYDQTNWNRLDAKIPLFCMNCMKTNCEHIDKCIHEPSQESVDFEQMMNEIIVNEKIITADKINEMLQKVSESFDDSVVVLWDTYDLSNYQNDIMQIHVKNNLLGSN